MDRLLLRVPGVALPQSEIAARLRAQGVAPSAGTEGAGLRIERIDGRAARERGRPLPAGALVHASVAGPVPDAGDRPVDAIRALVPAPPWRTADLIAGRAVRLACRVRAVRGGVAEVALSGDGLTPRVALDALARAGCPVLGDVRRGGVLVRGGLRLDDAASAWPDEPVFAEGLGEETPAAAPGARRARGAVDAVWHVSAAAARAVRRGHPWLLPDDDTEPVTRWRPGTLVEAVDPAGASLGLARIDGPGAVTARIWSRADGARAPEGSVADRVAAALARRAGCVAPPSARAEAAGGTDALRLVHGEADGLPGLQVDRLGPILRVLVTSEGAAHALVDPVAEALRAARGEGGGLAGPVEAIVLVLHLRAQPGRDRVRPVCVQSWPGLPAAEALLDDRGRLRVLERGLVFHVDPGLGEPRRPRPGVGLYLDQRDNRARLAAEARRGGRWLNLFAHTGAFSVALLAAGAESVVSVDLSRPYLAWLEENLAANRDRGVDAARHHAVRRDGRRFLAELPAHERFTGIVVDPPTAAAAGRRFWSTRRDLEPLLGEALARLEPGGVLLVSRNQRRARPDLADVVRSAARSRRIALADVSPADPGPDFPRLRGFREGDSFRGVLARRR